MKEEAKRKCPKCGKNKLRRLIGPGAAIVFKGSGFYATDHHSPSGQSAKKADEKAEKSETAGSTGTKEGSDKPTPAKVESKPEKKE
jgi:predicted nucleic acid-binding Zn ribbon protein